MILDAGFCLPAIGFAFRRGVRRFRMKKIKFDCLVVNLKSSQTVIPAYAVIQSFHMVVDSGSCPDPNPGFAGVTDIGIYYDFVKFVTSIQYPATRI